MSALDLLLKRRSVVARMMTEPGPNDAELESILRAGMRVPDHGRLCPWRFVTIRGAARQALGAVAAAATAAADPDANETRLGVERDRFARAPVVVCVVSRIVAGKIPEWEQILSTGAACQNMLMAAHSTGYVAQWLTEWCAYDGHVKRALGLEADDRIAGFVYIGTAVAPPTERERPVYENVVRALPSGLHLSAEDRRRLALAEPDYWIESNRW
ncbi:MAG: nitroreductase family protein [Alphaproteobacteria bacterium]